MSKYALLLGLAAFCMVVTPGCIGGTCRTGCNGEVIDLGAAELDHRQIFVDVTTVRIPADKVDAALRDLPAAAKNERMTITAEQSKAFLAACEADDSVRVVQSPKLLSLAGQDASIFIGETIRFASTEATEDGAYKIEEQNGSPVFLGYKLNVVATPSDDGRVLDMDLNSVWRRQLKSSHTGEDIARMGAEKYLRDLTVADRGQERFEMANGGHVFLGRGSVSQDDEGRYVLVTVMHARVLEETPAVKPFTLDLGYE